MISQTAEYALRAVVYLADKEEPQTTKQIARATRVPVGYLSKVLQGLGRAGIVTSQRGIGGGSTLARPASELTVLEVVHAVDPLQRITTCPLGIESHGTNLCALHQRLDSAMAWVETAFRDSRISEMLGDDTGSRALCETEGEKVAGPA